MTLGIQNRRAFNEFLEKTGSIEVGNRVSSAGSDDGTVIAIGDEGDITIQLHPYETVKKYKNYGCAKVVRWQPALDEYSRSERTDTTPDNDKRLIYAFFLRKLPRSPNKRDTVKLRHSD